MVRNTSFLAAALSVLVTCSSLPLLAKTDFNVVGREMAGMLQNSHYARIQFNADLSAKLIREACKLRHPEEKLLSGILEKQNMSARAWIRILRLSRTIADLEASKAVQQHHIMEASSLRFLPERL